MIPLLTLFKHCSGAWQLHALVTGHKKPSSLCLNMILLQKVHPLKALWCCTSDSNQIERWLSKQVYEWFLALFWLDHMISRSDRLLRQRHALEDLIQRNESCDLCGSGLEWRLSPHTLKSQSHPSFVQEMLIPLLLSVPLLHSSTPPVAPSGGTWVKHRFVWSCPHSSASVLMWLRAAWQNLDSCDLWQFRRQKSRTDSTWIGTKLDFVWQPEWSFRNKHDRGV